eukprot:gnl/MRDRNA2_/MRDRNA2_27961_c0_seq1.p1 gnl/MRDRNA2_/MRDRNA2_27961_c0~~gnl/MRDRNA2_/MRDRNA2_27961_c0_seq1.p1  ORF type:complete len:424 (-),score=64.23 gnl/MRDRNA2_/MRDRNA2_27961_c0_seq1:21-1154(-)
MQSLLDCAHLGKCSFEAAERSVAKALPACSTATDELAWQCASKTEAILRKCVEDLPCLQEDALLDLYTSWAQYYNKIVPSSVSNIFRGNVIQAVMRSLEDLDANYIYLTPHADTDWKELFIPHTMTHSALKRASVPVHDVPTSLDWPTKGFKYPVQDQFMNHTTNCGSCWAYAATTNIAGVHWMSSKEVVVPSVQQLVDCDYNHTEVYPAQPNWGCNGGFVPTVFIDMKKDNILLVPAESYPYQGKRSTCAAPSSNALSWTKVVGHVVFEPDEVKLAAGLYQYGPLAASLDARAMPSYKSGVADPWFFQCNGALLNHAVTIVGFGVDGKKYWRIQNCWGTGWGEEGFYRLVRGKEACGIDQLVSTAKLAAPDDTILV